MIVIIKINILNKDKTMTKTRLKNFLVSKIRHNDGLKFQHLFFISSEDYILIDFTILDIKTNLVVTDTYKFNVSNNDYNMIQLSEMLRGIIKYLNVERSMDNFYHHLSYDLIQFHR